MTDAGDMQDGQGFMRDMTEGSLRRHIIKYAVPMILGNIMQLTYNAVDSVIIGKFLGEQALAAVSISNPVMTLLILGASGIGIGASVLLSRFYGAGDLERLKRGFSTTLIFSLFFSLAVFAAGSILTPRVLLWVRTPVVVLPMARIFLRIVLFGFLFTFQYNILAAAMRSIGDSRTPVMALGASCLLNVGLDLLFVAGLKLGVAGAGLATAISEAVSAALCLWWIRTRIPVLHLARNEIVMDRRLLSQILRSGALTALQQSAQPIGKLLIQSVINAQGVTAIGAFNAVCRLDDFACIPSQSIGSGIMTCTAQNFGAGKKDRVRRCFSVGVQTGLMYWPCILLGFFILGRPALQLLTPDGSVEMIRMGTEYLSVKAWILVMACVNNAIQGYFRGLGRMRVVLAATCIQISIRALCVMAWVPQIGIRGEAYGCLTGWVVQCIFELTWLAVLRRRNAEMPGL